MDRFDLVKESFERKVVPAEVPAGKTSEYFGELVFDRKKMCKYLDAESLQALLACIEGGKALDRKTADGVARGMKEWAMEHGVTHVTHWFQPLTEGTAEKHDSLIDYDGKGGVIETFDGKMLAQQEPDASSFPSGGIRATFEARGYTAWDPTSPVFILDDTLCIPTIFISYTGEALDYKTPLKRALKAVSDAAVPICKLFDPGVTKVYSYLGWEQEYFLVDEALYAARTDLMITGRTLFGHNSSKNQQLDDHYFGSIPPRVAAFMRDLEVAGHRLGIPIKTRHNEVAPNQFELAPIYGEANLANDQNQIVMNLMNRIARKHGFVVLLHEKPFDGVNGSGKHNNWSLGTDRGTPLLAPGKDANGNLQFVTFFVNVLAAVQKHNALLKASIASATNAHRLGANEAPPAIVSAFLGRTMTEVLHKLLEVPSDTPIEIAGKKGKSLGLVEIPEIFVDNTDRNRTSPFAFTGNKFEFRSPGASQTIAKPNIVINTAVAESLRQFADALEGAEDFTQALHDLIRGTIVAHKRILFNGNGYDNHWPEEAQRRGLLNLRTTPEALERLLDGKNVALFERHGVFSAAELRSRYEILLQNYIKVIHIEAQTMMDMISRDILPAVSSFSAKLCKNAEVKSSVAGVACGYEKARCRELSRLTDEIYALCSTLGEAMHHADSAEDTLERAMRYKDDVIGAMTALRAACDACEAATPKADWPYPSYTDILFSVK